MPFSSNFSGFRPGYVMAASLAGEASIYGQTAQDINQQSDLLYKHGTSF